MKKLLFLSILFTALFSGCSQSTDKDELLVVCTTGMIGDAVKNLMGDSARVEILMGPGVDPHLYKATQGDISALTKADIIVYNGLHLEGKMGDIFQKLSRSKLTLAIGDMLKPEQLINSSDFEGAEDPHIWFDVELWAIAINGVAAQLKEEYPELAAHIEKNRTKYMYELYDLHQFCYSQIASIPDGQRIMITAHDAFKYFGRAYGIEVLGLQGISTAAEYGLQDISEMVKYITENKIKAIFVENSVPKRAVEAVIEGCQKSGHDVKLGGELYSDAMGEAGGPAGTYVGMVKHNVHILTTALK